MQLTFCDYKDCRSILHANSSIDADKETLLIMFGVQTGPTVFLFHYGIGSRDNVSQTADHFRCARSDCPGLPSILSMRSPLFQSIKVCRVKKSLHFGLAFTQVPSSLTWNGLMCYSVEVTSIIYFSCLCFACLWKIIQVVHLLGDVTKNLMIIAMCITYKKFRQYRKW